MFLANGKQNNMEVTHSFDKQDHGTKDIRNTEKNGGVIGHGWILGACLPVCPKPSGHETEVRE